MTDIEAEGYFKDRKLPETPLQFAGYAYLIEQYGLKVPLPQKLCFISVRHHRYERDQWAAFTPRHIPKESIPGHLTFALRYEGVDLSVLKALFNIINPEIIGRWVRAEPTGRYSRRIWFLFEWLMGQTVDVPDTIHGNYIDALDTRKQFGTPRSTASRRHRVNNNMPGIPGFCPLVQRSEILDKLIPDTLDILNHKGFLVNEQQLQRIANYWAAKEANKTYSHHELATSNLWLKLLRSSGKPLLSPEEVLRLQSVIIKDDRFVKLGLREDDDYIGDCEPSTGLPIPYHISASSKDVPGLLEDLLEAYRHGNSLGMDPLLLAATVASGYHLIQPLSNGNRHLERYVIHHVLEQMGFASTNFVFLLSGILQSKSDQYREAIKAHSTPCLNFIQWETTSKGSVHVINDTRDLYAYFDATRFAEFFYSCLSETLQRVLPEEIQSLHKYDHLKTFISQRLNFPDPVVHPLIRLLEDNHGVLSKSIRQSELNDLTETECEELENIYKESCSLS